MTGPIVGIAEITRAAIRRATKMHDNALSHGRMLQATHAAIDRFEEATAAPTTWSTPERRVDALREHVVRAMWRRT